MLCAIPARWITHFSVCLYEWQTLIVGLAALLVGAGTVLQVRRQIKQADKIAESSRRANLAVARAKLPNATAAAAVYAKQCVVALDTIAPAIRTRAQTADAVVIPFLASDIQDVFDKLLVTTTDESALFSVSAIYTEQQVFESRLSDIHIAPAEHKCALPYYYLQPVIIHSFAMKLLEYGRRETDYVPTVQWGDLRNSAVSILRTSKACDEIIALIDDKAARDIKMPFAISVSA